MKAWLRNPYYAFGPRPFREARLRGYIVREHRTGRSLDAIAGDPYVARCGGRGLWWRVLEDPQTLAALCRNDTDAIRRLGDAVRS